MRQISREGLHVSRLRERETTKLMIRSWFAAHDYAEVILEAGETSRIW